MRNEVLAQFNYSTITAPFSGVVTNTYVKEGDMATLAPIVLKFLKLEGKCNGFWKLILLAEAA
jgi:multidrug resistance efflux pump